MAAIQNPKRNCIEVLASKNILAQYPELRAKTGGEFTDPKRISEHLAPGAVHQGLAVQVQTLPSVPLENILNRINGPLVMLDGITDPRNIGAIFRSAAAFGACALIGQERHMPPLTGVLAKAAVGAVESVPFVPVVNLSRSLEKLADAGVLSIGLAGETKCTIDQAGDDRPIVLVMGAEGKGLRPNVKKHCDVLAKIPIAPQMESLNVASACAIALYELTRRTSM